MCDIFLQRFGESLKFLAKKHWYGVLKLCPANLDDAGKPLALASERGCERPKCRNQCLAFP
ncbi:hypothetical protein D9M72_585430 [compost metagenome]